MQNGIDIFKILTDYIKQKGCKVYLSVRMNDGHYADVDLSVFINESDKETALQNDPVCEGFAYIPETEIGKENDFIYAVSQAAPYVKSSVLPFEKNESAEITIKNNALQAVNLLWLELSYT